MLRGLAAVALVVAFLTSVSGLAAAASHGESTPLALPPPPAITMLPAGPRTSCRMSGPAWVLYGVHTPNGPPRRGSMYLVHAWGISCAKAKELLRAFFPRIPAHPMGKISGAPKGYTCKGRDAPGTVTKSRPHDGSCIRLQPATMFDWGPVGGAVG